MLFLARLDQRQPSINVARLNRWRGCHSELMGWMPPLAGIIRLCRPEGASIPSVQLPAWAHSLKFHKSALRHLFRGLVHLVSVPLVRIRSRRWVSGCSQSISLRTGFGANTISLTTGPQPFGQSDLSVPDPWLRCQLLLRIHYRAADLDKGFAHS